jgi:GTP-binding protein HflX
MPFETLDTTSRCLTRHGGEVVVSDTVGFIRRLPERLLASFESTLMEVRDASLLVLVLDAADHERELQLGTTIQLLRKLGAQQLPRFYVFNKLDRLSSPPSALELGRWSEGHPFVALSTRDADAVAELAGALIAAVRREEQELTTFVPYSAASVLSFVYGKCRVLASVATEQGLTLRIQAAAPILSRIQRDLGKAE